MGRGVPCGSPVRSYRLVPAKAQSVPDGRVGDRYTCTCLWGVEQAEDNGLICSTIHEVHCSTIRNVSTGLGVAGA
eukprot:3625281-Rhodomonas_salina.2